MVLCPACGSSRILNDYRPAPLALRIFFIRSLLCDHCNYQFKAFSFAGTPPRSQRHPARKVALLNQAPTVKVVDLGRLKDSAGVAKGSEVIVQRNQPRRLTIDLAALRLKSKTQQEAPGEIVPAKDSRMRRTKITKLDAQSNKDQPHRKGSGRERPRASATPACAHCGSTDVKRRHRTVLERIASYVSDHKAFSCRSCGETFYSNVEDDGNKSGAISATGTLL